MKYPFSTILLLGAFLYSTTSIFSQETDDNLLIPSVSAFTVGKGEVALNIFGGFSYDAQVFNLVSPPFRFLDADFNTTNFSIELWFKTDDNDGVLIGSGDTSANFWQVYIEDGKANFNFDTGGNVNAAASSENAVNDGKWHHLVAIRDGINSGKLYIDGKPVGTLTLGTSNSSIEAHTNVYIGRYDIENSYYFAGDN